MNSKDKKKRGSWIIHNLALDQKTHVIVRLRLKHSACCRWFVTSCIPRSERVRTCSQTSWFVPSLEMAWDGLRGNHYGPAEVLAVSSRVTSSCWCQYSAGVRGTWHAITWNVLTCHDMMGHDVTPPDMSVSGPVRSCWTRPKTCNNAMRTLDESWGALPIWSWGSG